MHQATPQLCLAVAVLVLSLAPAWAAREATTAARGAQTDTQLDLNRDAGSALKAADAELNRIYREIRRRYRDEPLFLDKLERAQDARLKFRNAELEALYRPTSDGDPRIACGSMYPMRYASAMEQLIKERSAQLRTWLDGVQEGDTCTGSMR
jgi:uncharacterized protein YecT (DUF1311 family)